MKKLTILMVLAANICFGQAGQIMDPNDVNSAYYISTPFEEGDLFDVQYAQSADVMYMVCPNHPPQKLTRYDHASWTIADVNWKWGPFLEENITTTTITPSGTTGEITLTADGNIFDPNHVGALWSITNKSPNSSASGLFDGNGVSDEVAIYGKYLLVLDELGGDEIQGWRGTLTLEKSDNGGVSWDPVYVRIDYAASANLEYSGSEDEKGFVYRVTMTDYSNGGCNYTLMAYNPDIEGYVRITAYVSATQVTASVLSELAAATATTKWAEGAWSVYRGYPETITFYEERLVLGGTRHQPATIWFSNSNDYENMRAGTTDSAGFNRTISAAQQNPIEWLNIESSILVGTSGAEFNLDSGNNPLTPANPKIRAQAFFGSESIQSIRANDVILFLERKGEKIRELAYTYEKDGFEPTDLTILSEHITGPGIADMAYQRHPDQVLWCVRSDGEIATMTYERAQQVVGWSRIVTDGDFESVACIPGTTEDEVWVVVNRDGVRMIEQFQPRNWGSDQNDCWFVDSGLEYDGAEVNTVSGLEHLEGKTVTVFADANAIGDFNVTNGTIVLDANYSHITAGLPYTATLAPMPLVFGTQQGSTLGELTKISTVGGLFYRTLGVQVGNSPDYLSAIDFTNPDDPTGTRGVLFTGIAHIPFEGGWDKEAGIYIVSEDPWPMTVLCLMPDIR